MHVLLLCAALSMLAAPAAGQSVAAGGQSRPTAATSAPETARSLALGVTGLVYIERSEPELDGGTIGGSIVFTARVHPRVSVYFEGGRARFYGDEQPGHRDFFMSGLVGVRWNAGPAGLMALAGPTLLHSERHKFFGALASNLAALTLGADYVWETTGRIAVAATWRSDLASGMTVHRPGFSLRFRF